MVQDATPLLKLEGVSKAFSGKPALTEVSLALRGGEIHALMGENGAGKSTLIKILTGIYKRDAGSIFLSGEAISPRSGAEAQELGISTVYQEVNLVPALSVAENIYLGREPTRFGRIQWKKVYDGAELALQRLGLSIDVRRPLEEYSIAIQQMTAIARALDQNARVLVLDEATSSLDADEVKKLFAILRELKAQGLAILLVTHFLDQVYEISDRLTILRNGKFIAEALTAEIPRLELIAKMMGQELAAISAAGVERETKHGATPTPWLECRQVGRSGTVEALDLSILRGENLGLVGLLGSGRTEVANLLFGIQPADRGEIRIDGVPVEITDPRAAVRFGLAYTPEDRKAQAILPELSVRENIILALQARRGWFRAISRREQNEIADRYIKALRIRTHDAEQPIQTLSGGNQQKAILARWLAIEPRLLIVDEPTRGIDVGAKAEIQRLIKELSEKGMSVLFISSEIEESVRVCTRAVVMKDRRKIGELSDKALTEQRIMAEIAAENRV